MSGEVITGAGRWDWSPPDGDHAPSPSDKLTRAEAAVFLDALAAGLTPTGAARKAGIGRSTFIAWRDADPSFAEAWERARTASIEVAEASAYSRAVHGWDEPVWYQGVQVGTRRVFSDRMLELILKAERPDKYRERVDHTVTATPLSPEELQRARAAGMSAEVEAAARLVASLPVTDAESTTS